MDHLQPNEVDDQNLFYKKKKKKGKLDFNYLDHWKVTMVMYIIPTYTSKLYC